MSYICGVVLADQEQVKNTKIEIQTIAGLFDE